MISPSCNGYNKNETPLTFILLNTNVFEIEKKLWINGTWRICFYMQFNDIFTIFYFEMDVQSTYPMNYHFHELFSLQIDWKLAVYQHGNLNFILTAFECHIYLKWCWRWWSNWNCINQLSINCRRYTLATGGIPRVANILKNIH